MNVGVLLLIAAHFCTEKIASYTLTPRSPGILAPKIRHFYNEEIETDAETYGDKAIGNSLSSDNSCDCACGMTNRKTKIVGGDETTINEFPWMAALRHDGNPFCGATLITKNHLLTAAHCVDGMNIDTMDAVLGLNDLNAAESASNQFMIQRKVRKVQAHPGFNFFTFNNDVAVVELDEAVDFNYNVQPACLPERGINYTSKMGVATGWGKTHEPERAMKLLRKVSVPIWSKEQCVGSGYGKMKITENMICAGYHDGEKDACEGDSGGPLNLMNDDGISEIVGIVSWGRGCARPNFPGVYTKVSNYLRWIQDKLNGECLCSAFY